MKIAIVGTGISGMVAAHLLHRDHDVTVFEEAHYVGGHSNTVDVTVDGQTYAIDTGFIVFNDWTYPNFMALLNRLGVESQPSDMSFSVKCERTGLEYNGTTLNALVAQRRNLFRPSFHRMVLDILRFNREALELLDREEDGLTLGSYLSANGYSDAFVQYYVLPMGAAIWSAGAESMRSFPARFFVRFFHRHGMLSVNRRPTWRVIRGGSREYVKALIRPFRERIRLNCPVRTVERRSGSVEVVSEERRSDESARRRTEQFDQVVFAVHSDQALAMLKRPSPRERDILGAIGYQENEAVLHTDASLLPNRKSVWASWNYHILSGGKDRVAVTYHMNTLQGLRAPREFCVTLNRSEDIDPAAIIRRITYHHPHFTTASVAAQRRHHEIDGVDRISYCGAYWGYGFHEDGVVSALAVCRRFGKELS